MGRFQMTDNELIKLFLPIINTGLQDAGLTNVVVTQSNQPTQQGINIAPTVYFYKIGDHRYGWVDREDKWDGINNVHTEVQIYETTFQISALVLQKPNNTLTYTASDLVNEVAYIMQNESTLQTLSDSNVGILRITDVRNPYFLDDRDNFEASPSFDFILTHKQTRLKNTSHVESIQSVFYPV